MSRFRESGEAEDHMFVEINITPFTDVVLVLLIIFMVTAPLMYQSRIPIKLPVAASHDNSTDQHPTISLTAEGRIYLDDHPVDSPAALVGALRGAFGRTGDHTVILKADAEARHGMVVKCLDAARSAGAEKLAISTKAK